MVSTMIMLQYSDRIAHVDTRIDPILIATVCIMDDFERDRDMPELFLAKLTNGKPVDYYAQHLKNLAILGGFFQTETVNSILAICTGVENLVVLAPCDTNLFKNPRAGRNLRRLTINLGRLLTQCQTSIMPVLPTLHTFISGMRTGLSIQAGKISPV